MSKQSVEKSTAFGGTGTTEAAIVVVVGYVLSVVIFMKAQEGLPRLIVAPYGPTWRICKKFSTRLPRGHLWPRYLGDIIIDTEKTGYNMSVIMFPMFSYSRALAICTYV